MTFQKVLKGFIISILIVWISFFVIAIAYKDDPIVRGAVRTMAVSIAGIFSDTRELQKHIKDDIKKELKEK